MQGTFPALQRSTRCIAFQPKVPFVTKAPRRATRCTRMIAQRRRTDLLACTLRRESEKRALSAGHVSTFSYAALLLGGSTPLCGVAVRHAFDRDMVAKSLLSAW